MHANISESVIHLSRLSEPLWCKEGAAAERAESQAAGFGPISVGNR